MKITNKTDTLSNSKLLEETQARVRAEDKKKEAGLTSVDADSVKVPVARAIQQTLDSLQDEGSKRTARVAELKALIQGGKTAEYLSQVPSEELASKLSEEVEMEIAVSKSKGA